MGQTPRAEGSDDYIDITDEYSLDGGVTMANRALFEAIQTAHEKEKFVKAVGESAWVARQMGKPLLIASEGIAILPMPGNDLEHVSDGSHTFGELYYVRMLLNAALFNSWYSNGGRAVRNLHKSKYHSDDTMHDGYFVVMAEILQRDGSHKQISFHYELKYWDLFKIWPRVRAKEWDGHTSEEACRRLEEFLRLEARSDG